MKILLLMFALSGPTFSTQNVKAAESIEKELYPEDRRIIMIIKEEVRRLRLIEERKKRRATMPVCPIEINHWYNLDCA